MDGQQSSSLASMMLPLAMFAAIFYFMILRPQKKKQKAHEEMLASISRGSTVVTAGGFFGVVREILDDSYIIELDEGVKARILKSSITMKRTEGNPDPVRLKKKKRRVPTEGEPSAATQADTEPVSKPSEDAPVLPQAASETEVPAADAAGSEDKKDEA